MDQAEKNSSIIMSRTIIVLFPRKRAITGAVLINATSMSGPSDFLFTPGWVRECVTVQIEDIDPVETLQKTACGCLGASSAAVSRRCNSQSRQSPPRMKRVWHWVAAKRPLELACCGACSVAAPGVDVHTYAGHPQGRPRCACCSRPIPVPNAKRSRY